MAASLYINCILSIISALHTKNKDIIIALEAEYEEENGVKPTREWYEE